MKKKVFFSRILTAPILTHLSFFISVVDVMMGARRNSNCMAGLFPQRLQVQEQVMLANLGWCNKSGECGKSYAQRSVSFCNQSGAGASIVCFRSSCCHV